MTVGAPAGFRLSWGMAVPYAAFYLACFAIPFVVVSWRAIELCAASYFVRMLFLTISYHRYFAHRAFDTSRPMQFVLGVLGALIIQGGPLWWAQTHRHHHRHADTLADLHAPRYFGFWYAHFGWFLDDRLGRTDPTKVKDLAKYPELRWLDSSWRIPLYLAYAGLMYWLGGAQCLVWGFCVATILLWNLTHWVQSGAHSLGGYQRFPAGDSRNHVLVGLLGLGEWHNNHHDSPSAACQGRVWWEVDVGYAVLRALEWSGLIWNLRPPRQRASSARTRDMMVAR